MIRNYIKTAFRSLIKNKIFTIINLSGLALGMSSVVLIFLFIRDELSYDKFHGDANDIYRIAWKSGDPQTRTPHPMPLAMLRDFPEVEMGTTLSPLWAPGLTKMTFAVSNPETGVWYDEKEILSVDSTFFDVFSFRLLKGNKKTALKTPNVLLVTESTAERYFGKVDPIGKSLTINTNDSEVMLEIAGVVEDVPANSHFHFDFLISYVTLKPSESGDYYTWADFGHFNYIKLIPGADAKSSSARSSSPLPSASPLPAPSPLSSGLALRLVLLFLGLAFCLLRRPRRRSRAPLRVALISSTALSSISFIRAKSSGSAPHWNA